MNTKRRALVLTDEGARHPFRRLLPAHIRRAFGDDAGEARSEASGLNPSRVTGAGMTVADWRDVAATYCAAFVAATMFLL